MIYVLNRENFKFIGRFDNMKFAKATLEKSGIDENECIFTEETGMKYVSRVVEVDGKVVYMNKDWWVNDAPTILENYEEHVVYDIINLSLPEEERETVSKDRFEREMHQNIDRISEIDGIAGEVEYNIDVGNDMIALFKEECTKTDFKEITPLELAAKLQPAYSLVMTGSFREAKAIFQSLEPDPFLTVERMQKYIDMLDAADAITYAEPGETIYTASLDV